MIVARSIAMETGRDVAKINANGFASETAMDVARETAGDVIKSAQIRVCNCGYGLVRCALPSLRNLPSSRSESMHSNSQFLARAHPFLLDSFQYLHNL